MTVGTRHTAYRTRPPSRSVPASETPTRRPRWAEARRHLPRLLSGTLVLIALVALALGALPATADVGTGEPIDLSGHGRATLAVFLTAVWVWAFTDLDDTYTALGAGVALVLMRVIDTTGLFGTCLLYTSRCV